LGVLKTNRRTLAEHERILAEWERLNPIGELHFSCRRANAASNFRRLSHIAETNQNFDRNLVPPWEDMEGLPPKTAPELSDR
jgi:hypothetical protein